MFEVGDKVESIIVPAISGVITKVDIIHLYVDVRGQEMLFSKDYTRIIKKKRVELELDCYYVVDVVRTKDHSPERTIVIIDKPSDVVWVTFLEYIEDDDYMQIPLDSIHSIEVVQKLDMKRG